MAGNVVLQLTGRIPPKKNSRINTRSGRSFPGKKYQEWHEDAAWQLFTQKKPACIERCEIEIKITPPDRRRYDLTNKAESIMDLLVDCGVLIDDNAGVVSKLTLIGKETDKKNCGAEIIIKLLTA